MKVSYYPSDDNEMWTDEVEKILPYCDGVGVDIGCGGRSPVEGQVRVDLDKDCQPDHIADAGKLPFTTSKFDYLTASHCLEHLKNQRTALKEWVRVVKPGGYILIIVPDREWTANRGCGLQEPCGKMLMMHKQEYNLAEFLDVLSENQDLGYRILDSGIARDEWSNYAVLRKK
jgi:predicted SAM-dependent methyltransferase